MSPCFHLFSIRWNIPSSDVLDFSNAGRCYLSLHSEISNNAVSLTIHFCMSFMHPDLYAGLQSSCIMFLTVASFQHMVKVTVPHLGILYRKICMLVITLKLHCCLYLLIFMEMLLGSLKKEGVVNTIFRTPGEIWNICHKGHNGGGGI